MEKMVHTVPGVPTQTTRDTMGFRRPVFSNFHYNDSSRRNSERTLHSREDPLAQSRDERLSEHSALLPQSTRQTCLHVLSAQEPQNTTTRHNRRVSRSAGTFQHLPAQRNGPTCSGNDLRGDNMWNLQHFGGRTSLSHRTTSITDMGTTEILT